MPRLYQLKLLNLNFLKAHEKVDRAWCKQLLRVVVLKGNFTTPIVVDRKTKVILDGHHRTAILKKLGYTKIPTVLINYSSPQISVKSRRKKIKVTKQQVIKKGLSQNLFPSKTTRHKFKFNLPKINLPLKQLS